MSALVRARKISDSAIVDLEGGFGNFSFGQWNDSLVLLKKSSRSQLRQAGRESAFLRRLDHPNIIRCQGVNLGLSSCRLVLGHMTESLRSFVKGQGGVIRAVLCWSFVRQLVSAIHYLHTRNILHRSISTQTIWVNKYDCIKFVDLRSAKLTSEKSDSGCQQLAAYKSPELHLGKPHTKQTDMYAFGIVLWEMITGKIPWIGVGVKMVRYLVVRGCRLPIQEGNPEIYLNILRGCLWKKAPHRMKASDVHELVFASDETRDLQVIAMGMEQ